MVDELRVQKGAQRRDVSLSIRRQHAAHGRLVLFRIHRDAIPAPSRLQMERFGIALMRYTIERGFSARATTKTFIKIAFMKILRGPKCPRPPRHGQPTRRPRPYVSNTSYT